MNGKPDLAEGDVVLVNDEEVQRNSWPLGRVLEAIKSEDGKVRKARVTVYKKGELKILLGPVTELVKILSRQDESKQELL